MSPSIHQSVGRSVCHDFIKKDCKNMSPRLSTVGRSVGWLVCHNLLKGREVLLPVRLSEHLFQLPIIPERPDALLKQTSSLTPSQRLSHLLHGFAFDWICWFSDKAPIPKPLTNCPRQQWFFEHPCMYTLHRFSPFNSYCVNVCLSILTDRVRGD